MATNKTITQRIAFEGGKEMELQLRQLGDAGTTAFKRIQDAANNADFGARVTSSLEAVRTRLNDVADAGGKVRASFDNLETRVKSSVKSFGLLAAGIVGVVAGFAKLESDAGKSAETLENQARAAGLSTPEFQNLSEGLKIAGIETDDLTAIMNKMNRTFGEQRKAALEQQKAMGDLSRDFLTGKINASQLSDEQSKLVLQSQNTVNAFNRLGISAADYANNPRKALAKLFDAFQKLPDGVEKSSLELEVFGRSGTKMAAVANEGDKGLRNLEATAQRVSPAFTKLQLEAGTKMDDAFDRLGLASNNLGKAIRYTFAPEVQRLVDAVTNAIVNSRSAILTLASDIAGRLEPIINDVIALLEGREIDKDSFVARAVADIEEFGRATARVVSFAVAAWQGFVKAMDLVASGINAIFGTNLTGLELALGIAVGVLTGLFTSLAAAIGLVVSVVGFLAAAFGGVELAIAAAGVAIGAWIVTNLREPFERVVEEIKGFFTDLGNFILNALSGVASFLGRIIGAAGQAASAVAKIPAAGGAPGTPGFAGGGGVRGPGTSRSDSILARLSNGEFVHKAAAVQYYGERFMHMVNNMKLPRSIASGIAGFADGGMIRAASSALLPGFANGGLALADNIGGGGRSFVLNIDGQTFDGLVAEDRTVAKLQQFATRRHVQSGGRKPAWFK